MRERDHAHLIGFQVIDDAVGKAAQRKSARGTTPNRPQLWLLAEDAEGTLELRYERQSEIRVSLARVEHCPIYQFALSLGTYRWRHFTEVRAREITSAAGLS